MADPPSEAGGVKATVAEALPAVACPIPGAPGTVAGTDEPVVDMRTSSSDRKPGFPACRTMLPLAWTTKGATRLFAVTAEKDSSAAGLAPDGKVATVWPTWPPVAPPRRSTSAPCWAKPGELVPGAGDQPFWRPRFDGGAARTRTPMPDNDRNPGLPAFKTMVPLGCTTRGATTSLAVTTENHSSAGGVRLAGSVATTWPTPPPTSPPVSST